MKKKIFVFGKVYDLGIMPTTDIVKDIEARLKDYTGVEIWVLIEVLEKEIVIKMLRGLNAEFKKNAIIEQDRWLLTGEGYQDFRPVHSSGSFSHFQSCLYYFDVDDVRDNYKKDAVFYGASRVRDVEIDENAWHLNLTLKY